MATVCTVCQKNVYETEKVSVDGKPFHKVCFRCKTCNGTLKLGSYASMEGQFYCKPCFKKNFFSTGNYSTGFGKLKPQQEFEQKRAGLTGSAGVAADTTAAAERNPSPEPNAALEPALAAEPAPAAEPTAAPEPSATTESELSAAPESSDIDAPEQPASDDAPCEEPVNAEPAQEADSSSEAAAPSDATTTTAAEAAPAAAHTEPIAAPAAAPSEAAPAPARSEPAPASPAAKSVAAVRAEMQGRGASPARDGTVSGKVTCLVCGKTVYELEKLVTDGKVYHKTCFRCKTCNTTLKLGSYASMEGETYCKPCFKKNFYSTGNYSTGFGKLKPQQEFDQKRGRNTGDGEEAARDTIEEAPATEV